MNPTPPAIAPEDLHPAIWRASQLARSSARCIDTGFPALSSQLGGTGWPTGTLVDLMVQQPGIGELRLLAPALAQVASRKVVLLQPPHVPQAISLAGLGIPPESALWVKSKTSGDALWAAEQVLRSASCGALLFWANHVRPESLRRLHLAAQAGETLFFVLRPLHAVQDSSPAPLRLALRPAEDGIEIEFVKRRGPQREAPMFLPLTTYQPAMTPTRRRAPVPDTVEPVVPADVPAPRVPVYSPG